MSYEDYEDSSDPLGLFSNRRRYDDDGRKCAYCGASISHMRASAVYCCPSCKVQAFRRRKRK